MRTPIFTGVVFLVAALGAPIAPSRTTTSDRYLATGTGAVSRSVTAKLSDMVSVKDFGAVCDGVTDDTVAITNAKAAAQAANVDLLFPGPNDCVTTLVGTGTVPAGTHWIGIGNNNAFNSVARLGVSSRVQPVSPSPRAPLAFPQGDDLWLAAMGAADVQTKNWSFNQTSTTSVSPGSATITVGAATLCPSTDTADPNCYPTPGLTAGLCPPSSGCTLTIDQDTANEEAIAFGSWSIASATTLTITFAKSHTQPYNVRQLGAQYIMGRTLGTNPITQTDRPLTFTGRNGNVALKMTNDTAGTFPSSAIQFNAWLTGINSGGNLAIRNFATTSHFAITNNANTANIFDLTETSGAAVLTLGNPTNNPIKLQVSNTAVGSLFGGGSSGGLLLYANQGGTGTGGQFKVRNNATDNTEVLWIDTAAKKLYTWDSSISTGRSTNTDLAGRITLAAGAGSYTFADTYTGIPICIFEDQTTRANAITPTVTTTSISLTGTGTDVIKYICVGQN